MSASNPGPPSCHGIVQAAVTLLFAFVFLSSFVEMASSTTQNEVQTEEGRQLQAASTLLDLLKSKPSLATLVRLLESDDASDRAGPSVYQFLWTNNRGSATLLAPTNKAFSKFFRRFPVDEDNISPAQLRRLLQYHVLLPVERDARRRGPNDDPIPTFPLSVDRLRRRAGVSGSDEEPVKPLFALRKGVSEVGTLLGKNSTATPFFRLTYKVTQEANNTTITFKHGAQRAKMIRLEGKDQRRLSIDVPEEIEQRILVYIVDQVIPTPELQTTGKIVRTHPYLKYFRKEFRSHMKPRLWNLLDDPQKKSTAFLPQFFRWECDDGNVFVNDTTLVSIVNYHFGAPGPQGGLVSLRDVRAAPNRTISLPSMTKDSENIVLRARKKKGRFDRPVVLVEPKVRLYSFPCAGGDRHLKIENGDVLTLNGILHFPICNLMPKRFETGSELCY